MKPLIIVCTLLANSVFGQFGNITTLPQQNTGKSYSYRLQLYKISSSSYPNKNLQLKLMQNVAILNGDSMLYPERKADYGSIYTVCPYVLYGYKKTSFTGGSNCKVTEQPSLNFTNSANVSVFVKMKVPSAAITDESKLFFGIYGAEVTLPNNTKKKLSKANIISFRLSDLKQNVRNYIKYDLNIDGVNITLDYIIERATVK